MTAPHWTESLTHLSLCNAAMCWLRTQPDAVTAWRVCERGDWMLWLASKHAGEPWSDARRPLVLAACACARMALPIFAVRCPGDTRPRVSVETAESWAQNEGATIGEVRRTRSAAAASAYASADLSASAKAYSFSAAAFAAYASAAAAATPNALDASADASAASASADAYAYAAYASTPNARDASYAARRATLKQCADLVRQIYPEPPTPRSFDARPMGQAPNDQKPTARVWTRPSDGVRWRTADAGATWDVWSKPMHDNAGFSPAYRGNQPTCITAGDVHHLSGFLAACERCAR